MQASSGGNTPPEILSTHPSNQRRINDLGEWIPQAKQRALEINKK
jgi:predicted Zn-dependent protease